MVNHDAMANSKKNRKEESFDSFEYVLNDFLEIKAEINPKRAEALKNYLLSMKDRNLSLSLVEGFRLNGHLVLIEKENASTLERLVFFNPDKGLIQIKQIPN